MKQPAAQDAKQKISAASSSKNIKSYYGPGVGQNVAQKEIVSRELLSESHFLHMKPNTSNPGEPNSRQKSVQSGYKGQGKLSSPSARGAIASAMKLVSKGQSGTGMQLPNPSSAKIPAGPQSGHQKSLLATSYAAPGDLYSQGVPFFVGNNSIEFTHPRRCLLGRRKPNR